MSALLDVHNLAKRYGSVRAVDGVSFSVEPGETLALVGESGCGKSTTGRCLLGLLRADAGEIFFEGRNLRDWRGRDAKMLKQRMQMVFQDPFSSLNPRMTVGQTLAEPLWIHRLCLQSKLVERVAALLELVGLPADYAGRHPHELSGGQRQRVVIARALALGPRLIVADEPVSALDVSVQAQILNLLLDLQERLGVAYLLIAHNLQIVRRVAQRTAVMYLGRIVEYGRTEAIFTQPRHPYTQALLSAVPEADPACRQRRSLLTGEPPDPRAVPAGCRFHPRCSQALTACRQRDPELLTIGEQQAACLLHE
jgi:oligopeptide transport system ATP-binding protein